jgi:uncharacterized protein
MQNNLLPNLLGSKLRAKVLGWLFTHTDERYFVRQLTGLLKEDSTNISRELARLEKTGILVLTTSGRQKYYQANLKSPIYNELHGLIVKTAGVTHILRSYLLPVSEKIKLAFIFGSIASRTETRASAIDVMIIGDIDYDEAASCLNPAQDELGREINSVVYPVLEFQQKIKDNHHFLKSVLDGEKIYLIGDDIEFTRLVN